MKYKMVFLMMISITLYAMEKENDKKYQWFNDINEAFENLTNIIHENINQTPEQAISSISNNEELEKMRKEIENIQNNLKCSPASIVCNFLGIGCWIGMEAGFGVYFKSDYLRNQEYADVIYPNLVGSMILPVFGVAYNILRITELIKKSKELKQQKFILEQQINTREMQELDAKKGIAIPINSL